MSLRLVRGDGPRTAPAPRKAWSAREGFVAPLPPRVLASRAVSPRAKVVYAACLMLLDDGEATVRTTATDLAELCGEDPVLVRVALRELTAAGLAVAVESDGDLVVQLREP